MENGLIQWTKLDKEIQEAKDIQTLTSLSNKLEAIRIMARQSKQSLDVQNRVAEYRIRVERKKGEWLAENIKEGRPKLYPEGTVNLQDVGITRKESSKAQHISKLSKENFERYIDETKKTNNEITLAGAVKLAKQIIRNDKIETQKEELKKNNLTLPPGLFDVIVIDPPWNYKSDYDPDCRRGIVPYPTMTQDELLNLKIPAKQDCILWLWTTNAFMKDAYELIDE